MPTGSAGRLLDLALVVWVVAWIAMGVAIGEQVHGLRRLSGSATKVGVAVRDTGGTLRQLRSVPFIGNRVGKAADSVVAAGQSTIDSGRESRDSVRSLSWMLAVAIAIIPSVPVLLIYGPLRFAAERERRSLRRLIASGAGGGGLDRHLAQRALETLPYRLLTAAERDPWGAFAAGRYERLARAELERRGVSPRARARAAR